MKPGRMTKALWKPLWVVLAVALFVRPTVLSVSAQTAPSDKRIEEIEKQIQALKQTVDELRRDQQPAGAQPPKTDRPAAAKAASAERATPASSGEQSKDPLARIRDEGLNRSQVMQTLSYLTDVIGPRLTGSPQLKRANEWTCDTMASWGLANAHLEAWGPFGRGWSLKRFSLQLVEPQAVPLAGYPKAWSPGLEQAMVADVVYLAAKTKADLEQYKGKLKGVIVLIGPTPDVKLPFEPLATRRTEAELLALANAGEPRGPLDRGRANVPSAREGRPGAAPGGQLSLAQTLSFLAAEGAAVLVSPSLHGDGGTIFVTSASIPGSEERGPGTGMNAPRRSAWSSDAPAVPAQITLAAENYNRLVRMIQQGEKLKMAVELQVQFHHDDTMAYNSIAEMRGSDLKDEIVMVGAHLDSWHAGTGATDNAAGVAAAMEAMRILTALKLQPRRTIRVGLWSGEEQGLLGSKAYVARHFGEYPGTSAAAAGSTGDQGGQAQTAQPPTAAAAGERKLVRHPEYDKLSAYFNLDNGGGKIRGVYMQGNEAVRPLFRRWLAPFRDLGAETLSLANTRGTDHTAFDAVGLPGFEFIQDPIDYMSRTHHSNADVFERIEADDMKQAATIMAAFIYNAAMTDEKLPRKSAK